MKPNVFTILTFLKEFYLDATLFITLVEFPNSFIIKEKLVTTIKCKISTKFVETI